MDIANQLYVDTLTGCLTRQGFIREVEYFLNRDSSVNRYAVVVCDIVNFKSINEIFGHTGGDKLLSYFGDVLKADKEHVLSIGRLESDWFAILIDQANLKLDTIARCSIQDWSYEGRKVQFSIRMGVYLIDDLSTPVNLMIDRAVVAMHQALKSGHLNYALFDEQMRRAYVSTAEVLANFRQGLEQREFHVYYQPIIQTATRQIVAAEALVRWQHQTLGFVSPAQFIPVLESHGLITELDRYVMEDVFRYIDCAAKEHLPVCTIAVNLSWQDFYDQSMMDEIIQLAKKKNLDGRGVNFEVTETSLTGLKQNCDYLLTQIRACGSRILLDDFGSGISSFAMIGTYPFDIVKIDISFIRQIESSDKIRSIIRSIINMCHAIGLKVVGEGVETKKQVEFLEEVNCDYLQGFYFAKPMPEEEFTALLRRQTIPAGFEDEALQRSIAKIKQPVLNEDFFKKLLNHIDTMVIVVDTRDHTVIYMNDTARKKTDYWGIPYQGVKCYKKVNELNAPCGHCTMNKLKPGEIGHFTVGTGENLTAVDTFLWEINGQTVFVEIGNKPSDKSTVQGDYICQIKEVLTSLPNQQCIMHLDVTANSWFSTTGRSAEVAKLQNPADIDELIRRVGSMLTTEEQKVKFVKVFSKMALEDAYRNKRFQYGHNFNFFCEDAEHYTRVNVHLLFNPSTGHIECFIYVVDITAENLPDSERISMENDLATMFAQADHDRRIDYLTTLRNRLDLNDQFQRIDADSSIQIKTVLMIDIDDFKNINDSYGHSVGDQCLHQMGVQLERYGKEQNILFYRYGGEEFLGIVIESGLPADKIAQDILDIAGGISIETDQGEMVEFTVSVGYSEQKAAIRRMVDFADKAMYIAKRKGKNCFIVYEE